MPTAARREQGWGSCTFNFQSLSLPRASGSDQEAPGTEAGQLTLVEHGTASRGEAKDSALLSSRDAGLLEPPERPQGCLNPR